MSNSPKIKVDIGAKLSAQAKISTKVPAKSAGRLIDALTDVFRPFSERRGLKADQIRLQREDVLIEIAQKTKKRMTIERAKIQPVPNKFLIPFLEKASLEETSSYLVNMWSHLLTSCCSDPSNAHPRYVQILSELTAEDAQLLKDIAYNHIEKLTFHGLRTFGYSPIAFERIARECLEGPGSPVIDDDNIRAIYTRITEIFDEPGLGLINISVMTDDGEQTVRLEDEIKNVFLEDYLAGNQRTHLEILISLSLIRQIEVELSLAGVTVIVEYVHMTPLGSSFFMLCDRDLYNTAERLLYGEDNT